MVVERGCGERIAGGVYLSCPLSPDGNRAVDDFLIDPPRPLDIAATGLSSIGTMIVPRSLITPRGEQVMTHFVLDIVGKEHYPNVADFVEEVRRFGLSRRIAKNVDFSLLDEHSRIILIHERAMIVNASEYHAARSPDRIWCPKDTPSHLSASYQQMCAALWWEDIEHGTPASEMAVPDEKLTYGERMKYDQPGVQMHLQRKDGRAVERSMPSFRYRGLRRPDKVVPHYQHAAFLSMPIPKIEVVRDRIGQSHEEAYRKARNAKNIKIEVVDE